MKNRNTLILKYFLESAWIAVTALSLLASAGAYAAAPASVDITYNLFRNGILLGTISERFETANGQYRASSEARATGLFALVQREPARYVSSGAVTQDGLQPRHFEGHHRRRSVAADFDWPGKKLTLTHDGQPHTLALPAGAQDRLSIMYQLMFYAKRKQPVLEVSVTNGRRLSHYRYAVHRDVTIDTPFKRLNTLHFVRQHAADQAGAEVWIAPEYGNVPVKVLILEEDGDRYEQVATQVDIKP